MYDKRKVTPLTGESEGATWVCLYEDNWGFITSEGQITDKLAEAKKWATKDLAAIAAAGFGFEFVDPDANQDVEV